MSEALHDWLETLPRSQSYDNRYGWSLQTYNNNLLVCPPAGEYPGAMWLPIYSDRVATWDDMMRMPEPYRTAFLKLRVLLPAYDAIRVEGLGRVDADQWMFVELDLDSDNML